MGPCQSTSSPISMYYSGCDFRGLEWNRITPLKKVCWDSISECDFKWKQSVYRGNKVEIRSLMWSLIQSYWCSYKKGNLDTDMHRERVCRDSGRSQPSVPRGPGELLPHNLTLAVLLWQYHQEESSCSHVYFGHPVSRTIKAQLAILRCLICETPFRQPWETNALVTKIWFTWKN